MALLNFLVVGVAVAYGFTEIMLLLYRWKRRRQAALSTFYWNGFLGLMLILLFGITFKAGVNIEANYPFACLCTFNNWVIACIINGFIAYKTPAGH